MYLFIWVSYAGTSSVFANFLLKFFSELRRYKQNECFIGKEKGIENDLRFFFNAVLTSNVHILVHQITEIRMFKIITY